MKKTNSQYSGILINVVSLGDLEEVKKYVKLGANVNYIDGRDNSSLIQASKEGYLDIVKYLVENHANIRIENDSPLIYASEYGHLNIVQYFILEKNQNIDYVINFNGCDDIVKDWAIQYKNSLTLKQSLEEKLNSQTAPTNKKNKI